jgi:hypothetical protein
MQGMVAVLLASIVAAGVNFRLDPSRRRHRRHYGPPSADLLREDIGLLPLPPRLPEWWEQHW